MAIAARINTHKDLIWSIADLLRGDYKQSEYGRVILPLGVLRRLDCVLEPTKQQVLARLAALEGRFENVGPVLQAITGIEVYNTSPLALKKILADPSQVAGNLRAWIAAFDEETRDVIEKFDFDAQIGRLDRAKLLYLVLAKVTEVDLHPDAVRGGPRSAGSPPRESTDRPDPAAGAGRPGDRPSRLAHPGPGGVRADEGGDRAAASGCESLTDPLGAGRINSGPMRADSGDGREARNRGVPPARRPTTVAPTADLI